MGIRTVDAAACCAVAGDVAAEEVVVEPAGAEEAAVSEATGTEEAAGAGEATGAEEATGVEEATGAGADGGPVGVVQRATRNRATAANANRTSHRGRRRAGAEEEGAGDDVIEKAH